MDIPNYTYLKLKMSDPHGVITIGTSFQHAYECEVECYEHVTAIVASKELAAIRKEVAEEAPDPKRSAGSIEPVEGAKEVLTLEKHMPRLLDWKQLESCWPMLVPTTSNSINWMSRVHFSMVTSMKKYMLSNLPILKMTRSPTMCTS